MVKYTNCNDSEIHTASNNNSGKIVMYIQHLTKKISIPITILINKTVLSVFVQMPTKHRVFVNFTSGRTADTKLWITQVQHNFNKKLSKTKY